MTERIFPLLLDARRARNGGSDAIARRQRTRLAAIVAYARAHSRYYGELYRELPDRIEDPAVLPVTTKRTLMSRFDEWVTDRAATLNEVRTFIADSARIWRTLSWRLHGADHFRHQRDAGSLPLGRLDDDGHQRVDASRASRVDSSA